ncbi:MAG: RNA methyltransferase [Pelolinea sp.]|nr:RNA methyltransferase [Pelolinea sp.]
MKQITSKSNEYIKNIRRLKQKKFRDETGNYYIEGLRLIGEALRTDTHLESILFCSDLLISDFGLQAIKIAEEKGIEIIEVTEEIFQSFSLKEGPQGLAAVGKQKWIDLDEVISPKGLWIVLDKIQDPGNLGTIMRSLDGAGGKGLILVGNSTDAYHPTAVRSSTGALFSKSICKTTESKLIDWKKTTTVPFIGTVCETAISYKQYEYPEDMILFMGSEQKGLQKEIIAICDELITIPMGGSVDSLNLACAASIVLFEIYDKRNRK